MLCFTLYLLSLALVFVQTVQAQTTCTTLQPVFRLRSDATSTVFASTVTSSTTVDCSGCGLVTSTFTATLDPSVPTADVATITEAETTATLFICSEPPPVASTPTGTMAFPPYSPTASPLPPIDTQAQELIDELSTAFLYTSLLGNGGDEAKICAAINPTGLDEITNPAINGTIVQNQVCAIAAINAAYPVAAAEVEAANRIGVTLITTALFAVQVAGGYAGGNNLDTLCSEIETGLINNLFIGYGGDVGTKVHDFVCGAAKARPSQTCTPVPYPANSTMSAS